MDQKLLAPAYGALDKLQYRWELMAQVKSPESLYDEVKAG
jgi:hypothetical protein